MIATPTLFPSLSPVIAWLMYGVAFVIFVWLIISFMHSALTLVGQILLGLVLVSGLVVLVRVCHQAGILLSQAQREAENVRRQREIARAHIFLGERYGEQWSGANGEGIRFWRRDGERDVLRKPYNPSLSDDPASWPRLTPQLCHELSGFVTPPTTIYLKIPRNVTAQSLPGHVEPPPSQQWTEATADGTWRHYYTLVNRATDQICSGVVQSLALKFPGPDTYRVEYILSVPIGGLGDIQGEFYIEMADTN